MTMTPRSWMVPAASAVAGLVAGLFIGNFRGDGAAAPQGAAAPARVQAAPVDPDQRGVSIEEVRRVVREELAAHDRHAASPGQASTAQPPEPKSATQETATSRANEVLVAALGRRQWTDGDAAALRSQFYQMTGDDQSEVLRQFSQAVNEGRLTVETDQVPF